MYSLGSLRLFHVQPRLGHVQPRLGHVQVSLRLTKLGHEYSSGLDML